MGKKPKYIYDDNFELDPEAVYGDEAIDLLEFGLTLHDNPDELFDDILLVDEDDDEDWE